MHYASVSNSSSCLTKLIQNKANLNIQDENGDTALHIAIRKKHIHIIYILTLFGADLSLSNKKNENLKNMTKKIDLKSYANDYFCT